MRDAMTKAVLALFNKYKNTHNDDTKRAAHDIAITDALMTPLEALNKNAKATIKDMHKAAAPGYNGVLLAEDGMSVTMRVNNGAARFDSKLLPAAIIRAGWCGGDGKVLTLDQINSVIEQCTKQSAPSVTITSSIAAKT